MRPPPQSTESRINTAEWGLAWFNLVQSINQSIKQDISNAPANKISRWRARQTMDEIMKK